MTRRQINSLVNKLKKTQQQLLAVAAEFGEVDNFIMQLLDEERDRIDGIIKEIHDQADTIIKNSN